VCVCVERESTFVEEAEFGRGRRGAGVSKDALPLD
jgi:hypothetical protein